MIPCHNCGKFACVGCGDAAPILKKRSVTRRGPVEALGKELYEAGMTATDNGFIAWDDIPAPMKFCWMAVAEHVERKFERRVPAPPHRQSCPCPECVRL